MDKPTTEPTELNPQEVVDFLLTIMRADSGVKQSDKVVAAAGLTNYLLAAEIGGLVNYLTTPIQYQPGIVEQQSATDYPPGV